MIELLNIPRRFLESSPLAQGCVLYILKVFIKRAARVAGKVLCFVIVPLPVFFHLKLHILNLNFRSQSYYEGHKLSHLFDVSISS